MRTSTVAVVVVLVAVIATAAVLVIDLQCLADTGASCDWPWLAD